MSFMLPKESTFFNKSGKRYFPCISLIFSVAMFTSIPIALICSALLLLPLTVNVLWGLIFLKSFLATPIAGMLSFNYL